jgi:hypothetical protein
MSAKPTPPAQTPAQDPIARAVLEAQAALNMVASGLLQPDSSTAKCGVRAVNDSIASLERGLALLDYEAKRQAETARRRAAVKN